MSPLNWLSLFIMFFMIFILFNMMNFYCLIPTSHKSFMYKMNKFTHNWKW